jgi:acylphosphatase
MTNSQFSNTAIRVRVFISGKVHGVGYRAATWDTATLLKVQGWVRNLRDGRVEAVFEGSADQIEAILKWCNQGPPAAVVQEIVVQSETPEGLEGFQIIR